MIETSYTLICDGCGKREEHVTLDRHPMTGMLLYRDGWEELVLFYKVTTAGESNRKQVLLCGKDCTHKVLTKMWEQDTYLLGEYYKKEIEALEKQMETEDAKD